MPDYVRTLLAAAPDIAELRRREPSSAGIYLLLIAWSFAMASILEFGAPSRWSSLGFTTIHHTGGPYAWAALWFVGCAALVVGRGLGAIWAAHALWLNAIFCTLWALSLAVPPWRTEQAAWSGTVTYGMVAVLCVLQADVYRDQAARAHRPGGGGP